MAKKLEYEIFDRSWNPLVGCHRDLPCAERCWAKRVVNRLAHSAVAKVREAHAGLVGEWIPDPEVGAKTALYWTGEVRLNEAHLLDPLKWRKPATVAALTPHLRYFCLTKRPEKMWNWYGERDTVTFIYRAALKLYPARYREAQGVTTPLPNLSIGTSASTPDELDARMGLLTKLAAAGWRTHLFLEPLIEAVDVRPYLPCVAHETYHGGSYRRPGLGWVVAGPETGPKARPVSLDAFRSLRDQCAAAGVPYWQKAVIVDGKKLPFEEWPEDLRVQQFPEVIQ